MSQVTFVVKGLYRGVRHSEWPMTFEVDSQEDLAIAQNKVDAFKKQLEAEGWEDVRAGLHYGKRTERFRVP